MTKITSAADLQKISAQYQKQNDTPHKIFVCAGAGCVSSGCAAVYQAALESVRELGLENTTKVYETGCMGTCAVGPVMLIEPERIFYTSLTPAITKKVLKAHLVDDKVLEEHTFFDFELEKHIPKIDDIDFYREQVRVALRNCGVIEYGNIDSYISRDGYIMHPVVKTQILLS